MGTIEIPYQHKDILFKSLTEIFANRALNFYDINTAPIVRAEPANLPTIKVQQRTMDFVFYLADDSYLHLEFQSSQGLKELGRFLEYDVALYRKRGKRIHTYVVYTADITQAAEILDCGSIEYRARAIYMDGYDGDSILKTLREKILRGDPLDELDQLKLAFLPLMKSSKSKAERTIEAVELASNIRDETQKTFLMGCVIAISDNFIDQKYVRKILEVLKMSKVLRALEEEAKDEGRKEGRKEGRTEGRKEGRTEGRKEALKTMARKLLLKGMTIDEVTEITGLSKEEIQSLA
ncbi:hypothetical protein CEB3_c43290 [Peptococcaceae bacterium CEB3]|nr:hypothetical protein CEB3_c43290 [Peptococcaceae bacterium CEB3]